jgi:hypothetical protein
MTHRLHTDLQGRLSGVLAGDFLTPESQVDLMAAVAIGTVLDDLIERAHTSSLITGYLDDQPNDYGAYDFDSDLYLEEWIRQIKDEVLAS